MTAADAATAGASTRSAGRAQEEEERARKALIARTRVVATKAGPVKVKIRPSKAGKKALRRKGRLRVKVKLTYTPTGGTARSTTKRVTLKLKKRKGRGRG